jgi:hypothetical protein
MLVRVHSHAGKLQLTGIVGQVIAIRIFCIEQVRRRITMFMDSQINKYIKNSGQSIPVGCQCNKAVVALVDGGRASLALHN